MASKQDIRDIYPDYDKAYIHQAQIMTNKTGIERICLGSDNKDNVGFISLLDFPNLSFDLLSRSLLPFTKL